MKLRHRMRNFFKRAFRWVVRNPDKVASLVCWVVGCRVPAVFRELGTKRPVCRKHMQMGASYEPIDRIG